MNKKLFAKVLSIVMFVVFSVFGLIGCDFATSEESKAAISLNETQKTIVVGESFTLVATTTPADAEVVWLSSDEAIVTVANGTVLGVSEGTATVTAKNDTVTATCKVTVTAAETQKYTVVFMKGDTQVKSVELAEGTTISYNGVVPSKAATEEYSYTFSGWSLTDGGEVVDLSTVTLDGNKTFYAVFAETLREYNVTWNVNGETTSETVAYGVAPEYKGETPTKPTVGNTSYTFKGWATSLTGKILETLPAVAGDVTYYAVFDEVTAQTTFTVTWKNGDEVLKVDENVEYESYPVYTGETPEKASSKEYDYVFVGWATTDGGEKLEALPMVTADVAYYAVFVEQAKPEIPVFKGGKLMYSVKSDEVFLPEGLLAEGVTLTSADLKVEDGDDVTAYANGAWVYSAITLTENEWKENAIGGRTLVVTLSNGEMYTVQMQVYAGIIDELSDFPAFFNNTGVESSYKDDYGNDIPVIAAPDTYGYYIVTKDLGSCEVSLVNKQYMHTYSDELSFEQEVGTNFQKTNGFNGVLDGQGYTLRFKLMKGGLVGLVLGNAVIKNLGVVYEDATEAYYGVFGYITNGSPEIRNCYIERTNNRYEAWSVFGIMSRPNAKLILHNTVVYAYNTSNNSAKNSNMWISSASTNAYLIHARANATGYVNVQNFAKVFNDAIENGTRSVAIAKIDDVDQFEDRYWYKENGSLIWKGLELATITWVKGNETVVETVTKGSATAYTQTLPETTTTETGTVEYYWSTTEDGAKKVSFSDVFAVNDDVTYYMIKKEDVRYYTITWYIEGEAFTAQYQYNEAIEIDEPVKEEDSYYTYEFLGWSLTEDGEVVELGTVTQDGLTYYAVFAKTAKVTFVEVEEAVLYSTNDNKLFLSEELDGVLDATVRVVSTDEAIVYYENGVWKNTFALTQEQIKANEIGYFSVVIEKGTDVYAVSVKSYAGVIDELSDFPAFFNNTAVPSEKDPVKYPAVAPNTYGYYIVVKDLGSYTVEIIDKQTVYTYSDELSFTQEFKTDYEKNNGFNGVLDGLGHTLNFKLMKGGLVGKILGNAVIKNLSIVYEDASFVANQDDGGGYGVFGYMTNGSPEIRNCYIERTNNVQARASVYGLMARPNGRLILHNTVVYGFNCTLDATWFSKTNISSASTNAYVICGRSALTGFGMSANFTKVYTDGWGQPYDSNGNKLFVPLADVADVNSFNEYWNKEESISWKGADDMTFSAVISTVNEK